MANLTDSSYFVREISIPNIEGTAPVVTANIALLNGFISVREPEYLTALMGKAMYDEFVIGLEVVTPDAKWTALQGLLMNPTTKESAIADYVFYWFQRNAITRNSGSGETQAKTENSETANPGFRMAQAYNSAISKARVIANQIDRSIYPSFKPDWLFFTKLNTFNI